MKLAEALILRADCQKKIEQLKQRLTASVKIQEGEQPPENPQELFAELDQTLNELAGLITKINKTNSQTELEGITLSDALAARDTLLLKRRAYEAVVEKASVRMDRYTRSEVKYYSTVNVAELQKKMDEMSKQYRELDTKIQEKNWTVDLLE
ncbi:DIP1984 family protein [Kamptonema formosum]|uniref:DIP1984 family protein n=1 Tax=Kamptonema formosum TaxID=331992 RepID=UPI00034D9535|nr:DIP1984 family protein [Oscillatoria sp. PCC 10802]